MLKLDYLMPLMTRNHKNNIFKMIKIWAEKTSLSRKNNLFKFEMHLGQKVQGDCFDFFSVFKILKKAMSFF